MSDDFEQLYKNQLEINESLLSQITELNKVIEGQMVIPDCKHTMCDVCEYKKFHGEQSGHISMEVKDER